ncbi:aryl-sulfate sulfotransferase [Chloroflexota bacterium]
MAFHEPTELRYWDKMKAYNGYTLFAARFPPSGATYLIDMEGNIVNQWLAGSHPVLLESGNFMDVILNDDMTYNGFQELDWDGNRVWEYCEKRKNYTPHHDFFRTFNKKLNAFTTMYIANRDISREEAIAAGCNPDNANDGSIDTIVEIDMNGNIVWEWRFIDHVIQDIDPTKPNYVGEGKTFADYPGKLNINLPGVPLRRDWLHCNSLDHHTELDQVAINAVAGEFYLIDHGKTFIPGDPQGSISLAAGPAGDFIYRFGDPARYGQGDPPSILEDWGTSTTGHKQIGGSHNIQWIREGLPGAGHFLIFNNGGRLSASAPQSYIFEINQYLDADGNDTGNYVNPPDVGYYTLGSEESKATHKRPKQISNQVVWIYDAKRSTAFFSHNSSGCQRLPNGNTLICATTEGHVFEVTNEGEVVWEYMNPVTIKGDILEILPDCYLNTNYVWRAHRYTADHPALAGNDLTPKGTITGKKPITYYR